MDGSRGGAGSETEAELRKQTTPQICLSPPLLGAGPSSGGSLAVGGCAGPHLLQGPTEHLEGGPSGASHPCDLGRSPPPADRHKASGMCCHLPSRRGCPTPAGPGKQHPELAMVAPRSFHFTRTQKQRPGLLFGSVLGRDSGWGDDQNQRPWRPVLYHCTSRAVSNRPLSPLSSVSLPLTGGPLWRRPPWAQVDMGEDAGEEHGSLGDCPEHGGPHTHLTGLLPPPAPPLTPSLAPPALSGLGTEQQPKKGAG